MISESQCLKNLLPSIKHLYRSMIGVNYQLVVHCQLVELQSKNIKKNLVKKPI